MIKRVYFIGSHSTGKTTLARYVSAKFKLPMITEVARAVLAEMEISLERLRTDIELVNDYQRRVFDRQVDAESKFKDGFVSDRAFDNLAYAAEHSTILAFVMSSTKFKGYVDNLATGCTIFFVRPHEHLLANDGVRERVEWDGVVRIDAMIKFMLEQFSLPYVSLASASMQERCHTVDLVLSRS